MTQLVQADKRASRYEKHVGEIYGRLKVTGVVPSSMWKSRSSRGTTYYYPQVTALCVCGREWVGLLDSLRVGHTTSCGCFARERTVARQTKHGMSQSPEFRVWDGLFIRCNSPRDAATARNYRDRGIRVCAEWDSFQQFYTDMGPRPSPKHSIERKDNDRGYSPDNCVWATKREQQNNRRNTIFVEYGSATLPLSDLSRLVGITYNTLAARLRKGLSAEEAVSLGVSTPKNKTRRG